MANGAYHQPSCPGCLGFQPRPRKLKLRHRVRPHLISIDSERSDFDVGR